MIHINNFVDRIKFFESKNSKDFIISLDEAKNLHSDITKLLLLLHEVSTQPNKNTSLPTQGSIDGGNW
jgi:hypothetical protein